jgi:hypothetical protein
MLKETSDLFNAATTPTVSDALSALIKSVRLRHTQEAVLWLTYLWSIPKERQRVKRRVLLMSGEDNISARVIVRVADWYTSHSRKELEAAATEVVRICATPNWWEQQDGREYIYAWHSAELSEIKFPGATLEDLYAILTKAVIHQDLPAGLVAFNALYSHRNFRPHPLSVLLIELAYTSPNHVQARALAQLYSRLAGTYWTDSNVSGQCIYALIHGAFGNQEIPESNPELAVQLIAQANERMQQGSISVQNFLLDGIHTRTGTDRRFAGVVKQMAGCCRAYEHFGRLSPNDVWLTEFTEPRLRQ